MIHSEVLRFKRPTSPFTIDHDMLGTLTLIAGGPPAGRAAILRTTRTSTSLGATGDESVISATCSPMARPPGATVTSIPASGGTSDELRSTVSQVAPPATWLMEAARPVSVPHPVLVTTIRFIRGVTSPSTNDQEMLGTSTPIVGPSWGVSRTLDSPSARHPGSVGDEQMASPPQVAAMAAVTTSPIDRRRDRSIHGEGDGENIGDLLSRIEQPVHSGLSQTCASVSVGGVPPNVVGRQEVRRLTGG